MPSPHESMSTPTDDAPATVSCASRVRTELWQTIPRVQRLKTELSTRVLALAEEQTAAQPVERAALDHNA